MIALTRTETTVAEDLTTAPVDAPAPPPAPAAEAPPQGLSGQLDAATASTPDPASAAAPDATQATSAAQWQGVRDYAAANGVELPFQDDAQALNALLASHRQASVRNYYADLGRTVAPHAQQVADYLQQRRQQAAAPQAPPAWQGPEFKKEWLALVEKDENTGRIRSKAGYDPGIAEKVEKYWEWREQFLERPEQVIAPLIEERARQLIDQRFAEQNERSTADQLVSESAAWMFAADPQGHPVFTQQGQRQLTPEGALYARHADLLWKAGMRDVRQIHANARANVENAVMRQRFLQQQPAAVKAAAAPPSVGGQLTRPSAAAPSAAPSHNGRSLREMLAVNLDRAGAPDDLNL